MHGLKPGKHAIRSRENAKTHMLAVDVSAFARRSIARTPEPAGDGEAGRYFVANGGYRGAIFSLGVVGPKFQY